MGKIQGGNELLLIRIIPKSITFVKKRNYVDSYSLFKISECIVFLQFEKIQTLTKYKNSAK